MLGHIFGALCTFYFVETLHIIFNVGLGCYLLKFTFTYATADFSHLVSVSVNVVVCELAMFSSPFALQVVFILQAQVLCQRPGSAVSLLVLELHLWTEM